MTDREKEPTFIEIIRERLASLELTQQRHVKALDAIEKEFIELKNAKEEYQERMVRTASKHEELKRTIEIYEKSITIAGGK